jgi:HK97 family phage major capsid protein
VLGDERAMRRCKNFGVHIERATGEGVNTSGGVLVPDDFNAAIVNLRELTGVFRRNAEVVPMNRDSLDWPRRTSGMTAYFVAENAELTESDMAFDGIRLTANKVAALAKISSELDEDSDVGEHVGSEIAYALSTVEDSCGWNGTGTSAYGGMRGVTTIALDGLHGLAKAVAATGHNTFGLLDTTDLANLVGAVQAIALPNARWFCSQFAYAMTFCRLSTPVLHGNMTVGAEDRDRPTFWGWPIVAVPALPQIATTLSGSVMLAFGDLSLAAALGDRRGTNIRRLTERFADADQIGIMGTERFDINVHDLGSSTVAPPLACLVAP